MNYLEVQVLPLQWAIQAVKAVPLEIRPYAVGVLAGAYFCLSSQDARSSGRAKGSKRKTKTTSLPVNLRMNAHYLVERIDFVRKFRFEDHYAFVSRTENKVGRQEFRFVCRRLGRGPHERVPAQSGLGGCEEIRQEGLRRG